MAFMFSSVLTAGPANLTVTNAASTGIRSLCPMAAQVLSFPHDWHQHPQNFLTEFTYIGRKNTLWEHHARTRDIGPLGKRKLLYRTDPASQFDAQPLLWQSYQWNTAEVTYQGRREVVLWTRSCRGPNKPVSALLKQSDTVFLRGGPLPMGRNANGHAYIVRNILHKESVDIMTPDDASEFAKAARPLFKKWWRAIRVNGGWRVYGDSIAELAHARLALSKGV